MRTPGSGTGVQSPAARGLTVDHKPHAATCCGETSDQGNFVVGLPRGRWPKRTLRRGVGDFQGCTESRTATEAPALAEGSVPVGRRCGWVVTSGRRLSASGALVAAKGEARGHGPDGTGEYKAQPSAAIPGNSATLRGGQIGGRASAMSRA